MSHTSQQDGDWRRKLIHRRMERTRTALAEKFDLLGQRVRGAAKVVENVTEAVQDTVETVQTVRLDIRRHPLLMVGGAMAVGYVGGLLLRPSAPVPTQPAFGPTAHQHTASPAQSAPISEAVSGWLYQLAGVLGIDARRLKRQAVGAAVGVARDLIAREIPKEVQPLWENITRTLTLRLGGEPIPGPLIPPAEERPDQEKGEHHAKLNCSEMARSMGPARREGEKVLGPAHGR
jgi:hypothetical protein